MAIASFEKTIEAIYSAAADSRRWTHALAMVADHVGGVGALICRHDFRTNRGMQVISGLREDLSHLYVERYGSNPYSTGIMKRPLGAAHLGSSFVDMHEIRRSAMYADIYAPQNIVDQVMFGHSPFMTSADSGGFAVMLDARTARDGDARCRRMARIGPHLSIALELSQLAETLSARERQLQALLEAMPVPAFVLNRQGRIDCLNRPAELLLANSGEVTVSPGMRLSAVRSVNRCALGDLIENALTPEPMTRACRLIRRDAPDLLAKAIPLSSLFREEWGSVQRDAGILIQILDPLAQAATINGGTLRDLFMLTPAEARVAVEIGNGRSAPEAAVVLGVSVNTVRTQLSSCFAKMGVRSQPALVQLLTVVGQLAD